MSSVEDVKILFSKELEELLTFEEEGEYIVVRPRQFLGTTNFAKVGAIIREAGGKYFSAGKMSHFKVPRTKPETPQKPPSKETNQMVSFLEAFLMTLRDFVDEYEKRLTKLREAGY